MDAALFSVLASDMRLCFGKDILPDLALLCPAESPDGPDPTAWVTAMASRYWTPQIRAELFGGVPPPHGICAAALATAVRVAELFEPEAPRGRGAAPTEGIEANLARFLAAEGLRPLMSTYLAIRAFEHGRLLTSTRIDADTFCSGDEHLPGFGALCTADLHFGIACRWLSLVPEDGRQVVVLTAEGEALWQQLRDALDTVHFLDERSRRLQLREWKRSGSRYTAALQRLAPAQDEMRDAFADFAALQPGWHLLDVGAGHGAGLINPGGLADRVGRQGKVTALDPRADALAQLASAAKARRLPRVRCLQATAEAIPLNSGSVDAVTSSLTLHFLDRLAFLREVWRLLILGGVLALLFPTSGLDSPFYRSLTEVARTLVPFDAATAAPLPVADDVVRELRDQGFADIAQHDGALPLVLSQPGDAVTFLLGTIRIIGNSLIALPYRAELRRRRELEDAVAAVVARFAPADRFVLTPYTMLRAVKPRRGRASPARVQIGPWLEVDPASGYLFVHGKQTGGPLCGRMILCLHTQPPMPTPQLALHLGIAVSTLHNVVSTIRQILAANPDLGLALIWEPGGYALHPVPRA